MNDTVFVVMKFAETLNYFWSSKCKFFPVDTQCFSITKIMVLGLTVAASTAICFENLTKQIIADLLSVETDVHKVSALLKILNQ